MHDNSHIEKQPITRRLLNSLLKIFFKLLYHQLSWTYDWVASIVSLGEWKDWVLSSQAYIDGGKLLEIGFGPGHLQSGLHHKGAITFGLDASPQMCRLAQKRLVRLGFRANLVCGSAFQLPFRDASFDQVIMTFPSDYIVHQSTFKEIHRVLVDLGNIVIIPWARITGRKPLQRAIAWLNRITGESPTWDENSLRLFKPEGFETSWEIKNFSSSDILIFKLTRQNINKLT